MINENTGESYYKSKNTFKPILTEKTEELAVFKQGCDVPAYDRLHGDAQNKQLLKQLFNAHKKQKESKVLSARVKPDYTRLNNGERLYHRSRIFKERMSLKSQREQKRKEEEKLAEAKFKPAINDFSHKYYKRSYKLPYSDTLLETKMKTMVELEKKREEVKQKFEADHPFVPSLNPQSKNISEKKVVRKATVHDDLFLDASIRSEKFENSIKKVTEKRDENNTFRPSIPNNKATPSDLDTLVNSKKMAREEIEKFKNEQTHDFRPTISEQSINLVRENNLPIYDHLIELGKKDAMNKSLTKEQIMLKFINKEKIQTTSTDMLEAKKKYILNSVFEVLDSDSDGYISIDACDVATLNTNLRQFFSPLMQEMEAKSARLDKEQFIESSLRLYTISTPTLRSALIDAGKVTDRTAKEEEFPFRPSISKKSEELAQSVRSQASKVE